MTGIIAQRAVFRLNPASGVQQLLFIRPYTPKRASWAKIPFIRQSDFQFHLSCCHFVDHSPKKNSMKWILLFSITLLGALPTRSQSPYSFAVTTTGHGSPIIFIPGLECSGAVWKDAVTHFSTSHTCYTLTLPGFAGQPPVNNDNILATVVTQLAEYIKANRLEKPVIVGHSLGGWVALSLEIRHPGVAGGLVIVSSAPFLPALAMGATIGVDSAAKIGRMIKKSMVGQTSGQVEAYQKMYLPTMIRDSARIAEVIKMAVLSDPPTQGEVMAELFSSDLRPSVDRIDCPVLALADWSAYKAYGATATSTKANLEAQYKKLSKANGATLTIAINDDSRHFIMYDEPQWFYDQVDRWLAGK
jgi:N-formylmaleamate deformylase